MMTPMRYVFLVLGIVITLHYIISFSNEDYGQATSLSKLKSVMGGSNTAPSGPPYKIPIPDEYHIQKNVTSPHGRKANAAIVMLARNTDLNGVISSMKQLEDRFNKQFQYPYVFLNEQPFDDKFKQRVTELTDSKVDFGLIPKEHWVQPDHIDEAKATASRNKMMEDNVIYGGSVPYRNMCRFNSGVSCNKFPVTHQDADLLNLVFLPSRTSQVLPVLLESRARRQVLLRFGLRPLPYHAGSK
jgi:alpha 1,2-mannosyltransferase